MTSFIADIIETILLGYSLWVVFCVITQEYNTDFSNTFLKRNLLLPIRFFQKWGNVAFDKLRMFFQNNM